MPSPRNLHLSPRKDNYTTPRRAQGRSPHRRHADVDVVSPRGRGFRMTPRPELASPGAGSYRHARSPGRGAYSAGELGSPGGRVVDVQRYTREVPRTIYDQEAYDVRAHAENLARCTATGSAHCAPIVPSARACAV